MRSPSSNSTLRPLATRRGPRQASAPTAPARAVVVRAEDHQSDAAGFRPRRRHRESRHPASGEPRSGRSENTPPNARRRRRRQRPRASPRYRRRREPARSRTARPVRPRRAPSERDRKVPGLPAGPSPLRTAARSTGRNDHPHRVATSRGRRWSAAPHARASPSVRVGRNLFVPTTLISTPTSRCQRGASGDRRSSVCRRITTVAPCCVGHIRIREQSRFSVKSRVRVLLVRIAAAGLTTPNKLAVTSTVAAGGEATP